jgi:hypothetical protein
MYWFNTGRWRIGVDTSRCSKSAFVILGGMRVRLRDRVGVAGAVMMREREGDKPTITSNLLGNGSCLEMVEINGV